MRFAKRIKNDLSSEHFTVRVIFEVKCIFPQV